MEKGMLQVYTGDGKGKTTAAIGLAVRAAGAGLKVFIGQFVKSMEYNEIKILKNIDNIDVEQYGLNCFIEKEPEQKDIKAAQEGLKEIREILTSDKYDVVILDEANIAVYFDLFSVDELINVIDSRNEGIEVIVTGRKAKEKLMNKADLVTNMQEIKHYYEKGVQARDGIER
ncbi:MAG TPA: cob(I)yrinic acid a,c-diamide adenosyltransferase [Halanaerobiales bacterium]|nr:cob(I)yrinic acid a,c-diamide adenosyltransferase [Halanaerobiales bacterium]